MISPVLTTIVPAYNIEDTLDRLIDSLCLDSLGDKQEVLVVNDGSADGTYAKALEYEHRYPSIVRAIDKPNGGHGSTINRGIQEALGKYVRVVDGDDWLQADALRYVLNYLERNDVDMILHNYKRSDINTGASHEYSFDLAAGEILPFEENSQGARYPFHAVIFSLKILKLIPAIDEHCFYVDNEYVVYPIPFVKEMVYLPVDLYVHSIGDESASTSNASLIRNRGNMETVIKHLVTYAEGSHCSLKKKEYMYRVASDVLGLYIRVCFSLPHSQGREFFKSLDKSLPQNFRSRYSKKMTRWARRADYHAYFLVRMIARLQQRMMSSGIVHHV